MRTGTLVSFLCRGGGALNPIAYVTIGVLIGQALSLVWTWWLLGAILTKLLEHGVLRTGIEEEEE